MRKLKKRQGRLWDAWHVDEVFVTIQGERQYLWCAVDQDGDMIDTLVQHRRNQCAAERFFRRLLKGQGSEPRWHITDKIRIHDAAHRTRSGPRFLDSSISEISAFPYATCCVLRSAKYTVSGVCRFNV